MSSTSENHHSDERFSPRACVDRDDALLKETDNLRLNEYSPSCFKVEYQEVCSNIRHYEQLRNSIMAFWAHLCGFLFAAMGLALTQCTSNPELAGLLLKAIGLFGLAMTMLVLGMEEREMDYFKQLCQRARVLEAREGFSGQYWRTYVQLVERKGAWSRRNTMRLAYTIGSLLWALVTVFAFCKM